MSALYPDVPFAPGVPNVLRDASNSFVTEDAPLTSDTADLPTNAAPIWGLYDAAGTNAVIIADSVLAVEYGKEERVSNYPIEGGGFESFNKVETPYAVHLTLAKGGSVDDRTAFLDQCEALRASTDLYTVITPETIYDNASVSHVSLQRNAQRGAQLITVEIGIVEVRTTAVATISKTQSPSNAAMVSNGTVQTQTPTAAQTPSGPPQ